MSYIPDNSTQNSSFSNTLCNTDSDYFLSTLVFISSFPSVVFNLSSRYFAYFQIKSIRPFSCLQNVWRFHIYDITNVLYFFTYLHNSYLHQLPYLRSALESLCLQGNKFHFVAFWVIIHCKWLPMFRSNLWSLSLGRVWNIIRWTVFTFCLFPSFFIYLSVYYKC
jgi:hypothetical protein